jgi:hypothetical protein
MIEESLKKRNREFEGNLRDLQKANQDSVCEIERLHATNEKQNLMGRFEYYHTRQRNDKIIEMYAKKPRVQGYIWEKLDIVKISMPR